MGENAHLPVVVERIQDHAQSIEIFYISKHGSRGPFLFGEPEALFNRRGKSQGQRMYKRFAET